MAEKDAKPKKQSTIKQIIQIYKLRKTRPCRGLRPVLSCCL